MTLVVLRCARCAKSPNPTKKSRVGELKHVGEDLVFEWYEPARIPVTWDGGEAVTPIRPRGVRRAERLNDLLSHTVKLSDGSFVVSDAYIVLFCRECGKLHGPRWSELADPETRRPTMLAQRPDEIAQ